MVPALPAEVSLKVSMPPDLAINIDELYSPPSAYSSTSHDEDSTDKSFSSGGSSSSASGSSESKKTALRKHGVRSKCAKGRSDIAPRGCTLRRYNQSGQTTCSQCNLPAGQISADGFKSCSRWYRHGLRTEEVARAEVEL